jgi:hypothetical protein
MHLSQLGFAAVLVVCEMSKIFMMTHPPPIFRSYELSSCKTRFLLMTSCAPFVSSLHSYQLSRMESSTRIPLTSASHVTESRSPKEQKLSPTQQQLSSKPNQVNRFPYSNSFRWIFGSIHYEYISRSLKSLLISIYLDTVASTILILQQITKVAPDIDISRYCGKHDTDTSTDY